MNSAESLVRHYAVSEALHRGTALAANLILISIIATEKGFGAEGVLISAFLQLTIAGLLEIPTGRFADRKGWYRSVQLGFALKIVTTLSYVGAVLAVRFSSPMVAWALIALEAFVDSFASAFINGAYQAGYTHWYESHLDRLGIAREAAPPLFLSSFRYGLAVRLSLPLAALLVGSLLFKFVHGGQEGLAVYMGLLILILFLRFVVIARTRADLLPLAAEQQAAYQAAPEPSLVEVLESRFHSLLLYAFATFISVACGFYLYGETYRSLASLIPNLSSLWLGGTVIGFSLHVSAILISRASVRWIENSSTVHVRRIVPGVIGAAAFASLALLLWAPAGIVHVLTLFSFSLAAMTAGTYIQAWVKSHDAASIRPAIRATWFSLSEVVGLLAFGFLSGLSLISEVPRAGIWVLLIAVGLSGLGLAVWGAATHAEETESKITLKQYLSLTLVGTAFTFFCVLSIFEARSFVDTSRTLKQDGHKLVLQVLKSGIREPVIQGSYTEAAARLDAILQERKDLCIEIAFQGGKLGDCQAFRAKTRGRAEQFRDRIFFDQSQANQAAELTLYGDYSDIQAKARRRLVTGLLSYLMTAGVLFLAISLSSRRIYREVEGLLSRGKDASGSFLIREFDALRDELAEGQKLKDEALKHETSAEVARQVAHDIRSPLAALEVASRDVASLPEDKRLLIRSAVDRIRDIANTLLDRHKDSDDAAPGDTAAPHLLSSLIEPVVTEKRLQVRSQTEITIETRWEEGSYGVFARVQPGEFKRALSNLLTNGVEALEPGKGGVTVSLSALGGSAVIEVTDDGKGIPAEIIAKLGQKGLSHGKPGGSGLGLYYARAWAEGCGGKMEISSEQALGTTVRLVLPRAEPPAWFVPELRVPSDGSVVVLDDDLSIHHVWRERFGAAKELVHMATPQELRAWLRGRKADSGKTLFLLDYEFLGFSDTGLSLAEELGIGSRSVIVTSRYEEGDVIAGCRKIGSRLLPKSLAGLVPIKAGKDAALDAVLIDDDELARTTWKVAAARAGKSFKAFSSVEEFLTAGVPLATPLYVDAELGSGVKGDREAERLHGQGYSEIYLATGHDSAAFLGRAFLRGVRGKEPPWNSSPNV
jgi:signal transduction histidine kinase